MDAVQWLLVRETKSGLKFDGDFYTKTARLTRRSVRFAIARGVFVLRFFFVNVYYARGMPTDAQRGGKTTDGANTQKLAHHVAMLQ